MTVRKLQQQRKNYRFKTKCQSGYWTPLVNHNPEKLSKSSRQTKSPNNSDMLYMFTSNTCTDFRTVKATLLLQSVPPPSPPHASNCGRNSLSSSKHSFFFSLPCFQNLRLKVVPPCRKGRVLIMCKTTEHFSKKLADSICICSIAHVLQPYLMGFSSIIRVT